MWEEHAIDKLISKLAKFPITGNTRLILRPDTIFLHNLFPALSATTQNNLKSYAAKPLQLHKALKHL